MDIHYAKSVGRFSKIPRMTPSNDFSPAGMLLRIAFSVALVFVTFNPSGHSYYHWLQANLSPIEPGCLGPLPGIGMSWAHIRARIAGQASVDRVDA
jgi:hypothetical protein